MSAPAKTFTVPAALTAQIDELVTHYPEQRSAVLMVLHALQDHFGHLSEQAIEWTAGKLGLQPIHVYELVTFYPMFHQEQIGKYHLKICRTLSCALAGSHAIRDHLCQKLGLDPHRHEAQTTPDGKFTVEFVECLASCGTAPVLMCNEVLHETMDPEKAAAVLRECA